jgi:hypothetical protein
MRTIPTLAAGLPIPFVTVVSARATIQDVANYGGGIPMAINSTADGDSVSVGSGTHFEELRNVPNQGTGIPRAAGGDRLHRRRCIAASEPPRVCRRLH